MIMLMHKEKRKRIEQINKKNRKYSYVVKFFVDLLTESEVL